MEHKLQTYRGEKITVTFDRARCIHAGECIRALPDVFDTSKARWIAPNNEAPDKLAEVVSKCPSGALQYQRADGGPAETPPAVNSVKVSPHGPLYLRGDIDLTDSDGTVLHHDTRLTLCRCGKSNNKPFCDNQHIAIKFRDRGEITPDIIESTEEKLPAGKLVVEVSHNGPLGMRGPMTISRYDGSDKINTTEAWFCRCGGSGAKPFCDSTHQIIGFKSE